MRDIAASTWFYLGLLTVGEGNCLVEKTPQEPQGKVCVAKN